MYYRPRLNARTIPYLLPSKLLLTCCYLPVFFFAYFVFSLVSQFGKHKSLNVKMTHGVENKVTGGATTTGYLQATTCTKQWVAINVSAYEYIHM